MTASVIIPARNRASVVSRAVESALDASDVEEVIVVDDASSDGTRELLQAFGDRIRVITDEFGSPARARNAGAKAANAPLLAFLDSDDEMLPDKVTGLAPRFRDPAVGLAHGFVDIVDETGKVDPQATAWHRRYLSRGINHGTSYARLASFCAMFTSATLIRKTAFESIGGYDESLMLANEDLDLYLRLSLGWSLVYEPATVARYRIWHGNFDPTSHAEGMREVASKHLSRNDLSRGARFGFLKRLALSNHILGERTEARRSALRAGCTDPWRAIRDVSFLRVLFASLLSAARRRRDL